MKKKRSIFLQEEVHIFSFVKNCREKKAMEERYDCNDPDFRL